MKKLVYIIIVLLLIAVGGAGYLTYKHFSQAAPEPKTIESKLGLKTYTSYGGDFSVDYPSKWSVKHLEAKGNTLQAISVFDEHNNIIGAVSMSTNPTRTAKEALTPRVNRPTTIHEQGEILIANRTGYFLISEIEYAEKNNGVVKDRSYAVKDGDTLFILSFDEYSNVSYDGLIKPYDNKKYADDFMTLVKTFRINN